MIIVGLQNSEKKYERTRHNAGAIVLKYLAKQEDREFELDKYTNSFKCGNFYLPDTFMNLSGESVKKILKKEAEDSKDLVVLFDDITIPIGQYKISVGEGASSHNGIKSIIEQLGGKNDFKRVRIGVGKELDNGKLYEPGPDRLSDFVLSNMNNLEIAQIQSLAQKIIEGL
jgi:PTH1 family peptidyl-tRNA hydrolase